MKLNDVLNSVLPGNTVADQIVPPSGHTARLTLFSAAAMAFLVVFSMALSFASARLADRWSSELARTATIRISAPKAQMSAQADAVLTILQTTPGVASAKALDDDEHRALLEPWFGPDIPIDVLPIPQLIEIVSNDDGLDFEGLKLRLKAEVPGAVVDDHTAWRRPLVAAAGRLRFLAVFSILLIAVTTAAMMTLAANSALAANGQVIRVLRLVGAKDSFIARAFVRRFSLRAFAGAATGTLIAGIAIALLPDMTTGGGFLTGLAFQGGEWLWLILIPFLATLVAWLATQYAAMRALKELM